MVMGLRRYKGRSLLRTIHGRPTNQTEHPHHDNDLSPEEQHAEQKHQSNSEGGRSPKRKRSCIVDRKATAHQPGEDFDRSPDASSDEESIETPGQMEGVHDLSRRSSVPPDRESNAGSEFAAKTEANIGQKRKSDGSAVPNNELVTVLDIAEGDPFYSAFSISQKSSRTYRSSGQRSTPTANIHGSQNKKSRGQLDSTRFWRHEPSIAPESKSEKRTFRTPHVPLSETTPNKRSGFRHPLLDESREGKQSPVSSAASRAGFIFPESSQASSLTPPSASENNEELEILGSSAPILITDIDPASATARCPICDDHVDRTFLETFNDGQKLRWKDKLEFCTAHKQRSAVEKWSDNKYPTIKWKTLDRRLRKFHKQLTGIVEGRQTSYYRNRLEEKVESGKNRNALKNPELADSEIIVPGYYGHKGARIMMDHLMAAFSTKIRRVAASDRLMPQIGVSIFVQAVLVPEVAVMLVKEDLKVDDEQARVVLKESAEVGDLVNAEEEDRLECQDGQSDAQKKIGHVIID